MTIPSLTPGSCLWCDREAEMLGLLCSHHRRPLGVGVAITPEQLVQRDDVVSGPALIDCFGIPHGLNSGDTVGRGEDNRICVLHHSVSHTHARIVGSETFRVHDIDSLNGTTICGEPVQAGIGGLLFEGDVVAFGDVRFFFTVLVNERRRRHSTAAGETVRVFSEQQPFVARVLFDGEVVVTLVEAPPGGIAQLEDSEVSFSKMEFALLKTLVESQPAHADVFIPSATLAEAMQFQSIEASGENVRELVKRVRRKARSKGLADLIASRPRQGYRLGGVLD